MEVLKILKNNRLVKAMTGLTKEEFYELLPAFSVALHVAAKQRRPNRKRNIGAGQKGTCQQ